MKSVASGTWGKRTVVTSWIMYTGIYLSMIRSIWNLGEEDSSHVMDNVHRYISIYLCISSKIQQEYINQGTKQIYILFYRNTFYIQIVSKRFTISEQESIIQKTFIILHIYRQFMFYKIVFLIGQESIRSQNSKSKQTALKLYFKNISIIYIIL